MLSSDRLSAVLQRFLFLLSLLRPKLTQCCERYTNRSSFDRLTVENPEFCDLTVMIMSELHVSRADLKSTGRPNAIVTVIFRLNVHVSLLDRYSVRPPLDSFERFTREAACVKAARQAKSVLVQIFATVANAHNFVRNFLDNGIVDSPQILHTYLDKRHITMYQFWTLGER